MKDEELIIESCDVQDIEGTEAVVPFGSGTNGIICGFFC